MTESSSPSGVDQEGSTTSTGARASDQIPRITATSGTGQVAEWLYAQPAPEPVETRNLFDAVVIGAHQLELRPRSELAKYLLHIWLGGDVQRSGRLRGTANGRYGGSTEALCFQFSTRPMLAKGDDPYYTGMTITDEEQEACRKIVDEMRAAKRPKVRTARRRRPR